MKNITNTEDLKKAIFELENEQILKGNLVKEQFLVIHESIKPVNIIKNTIKELVSSPDVKTGLLDITIGVTSGFFAKKAVVGNTHNVFKQLMGSMVQMIVTKEVTKNADGLIKMGKNLFSKVTKSNTTEDSAEAY